MLKKTSQKGFTIVELLIVIVVIGILAALVLNTFAGVQAKARDTERQTDINSIATQLEVYYNDTGFYPPLSGITTTNLKGLDAGALKAPKGTANSLATTAPSAASDVYQYVATDCVSPDVQCTGFTLSYWQESIATPAVKTKDSLNKP